MRLGAFGDVVRTLPAAWALRRRYPEARLGWLVEPGSAPLLRRLPWLDEVIEFPRDALEAALAARRPGVLARDLAALRRGLRARRFDCVVDFHGILKSGVLCRLTGAPRRIGLAAPHAREGASLFYGQGERVTLPSEPCSRWTRNAALARHLDAHVDDARVPGLAPPGSLPGSLPGSGSGDARGAHAVLHPGSSRGTPHKRYPIEQLAVVARTLRDELGAPCVVTCGTDDEERALAAALVDCAAGAARLVETGDDPGALIAALAAARVVVSGDTGPLHLASLLGTRVVQILGPTHPVQNEPWPHTPWARAYRPLGCSPCRRGCAAAPCLADLPPDAVCDAVRRVLAADAPPATAEAPSATRERTSAMAGAMR